MLVAAVEEEAEAEEVVVAGAGAEVGGVIMVVDTAAVLVEDTVVEVEVGVGDTEGEDVTGGERCDPTYLT